MSYNVNITRQGISALFDLKGDRDALGEWARNCLPDFPTAPNSLTRANGISLLHIGRNHWVARAGIDRENKLSSALEPEAAPPDISIVRISDTLAFFDITGPDAAAVMAMACPLDLHPAGFGDNVVTFTEVFGLKALLLRVKDGFEFGVEQSFADMIAESLRRATA